MTAAPPFYVKLGLRPIQMKTWANMARTFLADGMVPLKTKIRIGRVAASIDNYDWFLHESERWLSERGVPSSTTRPNELTTDVREQKILHFTHDIALNSYKITGRRIAELKNEGLKEEEILEIICVVSFICGESRLSKCLV